MSVSSAKLLDDKMTVQLTTSTQVEGKTYTVTMDKSIFGASATANVTGTFAASKIPVVTETTPNVQNLTNLSATGTLKDSIKIKFNKAMDESTINSSTVKLFNVTDGVYVQPETYGVTYLAATNEIQFNAKNSDMKADRQYKLTVSSTVKALDGTALGQDYSLAFSTADPAAPGAVNQMVAAFPAINAGTAAPNMMTNTTMTVRFLKGLMPEDVNTDNVKLFECVQGGTTKTGDPVAIDVSYDAASMTLKATPKTALKEGTTYRLYITNGLRNAIGNYSNPTLKSELNATDVCFKTVDQTAGKIVDAKVLSTNSSTSPVEFTGTLYNLANKPTFVLSFDKAPKQTSADTAVKVLDENGNTVVNAGVLTVSNTVDAQAKTITVAVGGTGAGLTAGKKYSISIDGLVDTADNVFATSTYNFTVGVGPSLGTIHPSLYTDVTAGGGFNGLDTVHENAAIFVDYTPENPGASQDEIDKNSVKPDKFKLIEVATGTEVPATVGWDYSTNMVVVKPVSNLKSDTDYKLVVSQGAIAGATGNLSVTATNEHTFNFTSGDHVGPTIAKVEATVNKAQVAMAESGSVDKDATAITLSFDDIVNGADLTGSDATHSRNFTLKDITGNSIIDISGVIAADPTTGKKVVINTTGLGLTAGHQYELTVSKNVTDDAGNFLNQAFSLTPQVGPSDYTLRFQAANDTKAPSVEKVTDASLDGDVITSGVDSLANDEVFCVKLDKTLDSSLASNTGVTLGTANVRLVNKATGANASTAATVKAYTKTGSTYSYLEVTLDNTVVTADGQYELTLMGLKDASNNVMADYKFAFSVDVNATAIVDSGTPNVNSSAVWTVDNTGDGIANTGDTFVPVKNATNVLVGSPIYVKLNEAVTGLDTTSVTLADADGKAVAGTVVVDGDKKGFTFKPSADLANDTVYKLTMNAGLADEAGNKTPLPMSFKFQTVAAALPSSVKVSSVTPTTDVFTKANPDSSIVVKFNQPIKAADLSNIVLKKDANTNGKYDSATDTTVLAKLYLNADKDTVTIMPDAVLDPSAQYILTFSAAVDANTGSATALPLTADGAAAKTIFVNSKDATTAEGSLGINAATYTNGVLKLTFDRVVDAATAKLIASYDILGGSITPLGNGVVSTDGLTVTFVCDTTKTVIVPGTTTIAPKATTVLYEDSVSATDGKFGTVAATIK